MLPQQIFSWAVVLELTEHILRVSYDITGIYHAILSFYFIKISSYDGLFNCSVRRLGKRKGSSGNKPRCFVMRKPLQNFPAITANIIYHTVIYRLFARRENLTVERRCPLNWVESIISVPEINVTLNRTMHTCLTVFHKEETLIKGIVKALNIVKGFLEC